MNTLSFIIAYIDPGTGSIIIQALIAAFVGISLATKFFWHSIATFFGFRKKEKSDKEE